MSDCPCDTPPVLRLEIAAGLNALPRQLRAFPEVRRALLAALPTEPALRDWRARNSRDLGLMLLEMWAYVSDVLGFYDERIANESYIRTAQRRPSLRRLVELIGYVPAPGIAGKVTLAAIAEGRVDVTLPVGTGFRSDAFADQPPQVFEITEQRVINSFKNEWTIGPVAPVPLPQATPTELAGGTVQPSSARTFFVFETAAFALAEGKIVVVTADGFDSQATRVKKIRPFGAKDGKTYNEVELAQSVAIPEGGVLPEFVHAQKPTTVIKPIAHFEGDASAGIDADPLSVESVPSDSAFLVTVILESQTSQLRPTDPVVIRGATDDPEALSPAIVQTVGPTTVTVNVIKVPVALANGTTKLVDVPIKQTVTQVTLLTSSNINPSGGVIDSTLFSLEFNMISGGTITTVAKTDLARVDIEGKPLQVNGIVPPPPDAKPDLSIPGNSNLTGTFLLSDPNKHGAGVTGKMQFDSSGRARLIADSNSLNPPEQIFRTPVTVLGNILFATRGETVNNEVLGDGDPRVAGQKFKLKKKPLTYLLNDIDRISTLHVFVDNVQWHEVKSFLHCGSQSRVFTVRHDDNQETFLTFGDGVHGSRLPSGVGNVIATYRFGAGKVAPPAGAITQIARPVIGLRAVRSPIAASEGRDPEGPEELRAAAPKTALLFDRVVSARDFEIVAGLQAGVVKVSAHFAWIPELGAAGVVVRFIGTPSEPELQSALQKRAELNLLIDVHKAVAVSSTLRLAIEIDPDFQVNPVVAAVTAALFDPKTGPLVPVNATISPGQFLAGPIFETVHAIPGVVAIKNAKLDRDGLDTVDFGQEPLACIEKGADGQDQYLTFDPQTGVVITPLVPPTGAVTATRTESC